MERWKEKKSGKWNQILTSSHSFSFPFSHPNFQFNSGKRVSCFSRDLFHTEPKFESLDVRRSSNVLTFDMKWHLSCGSFLDFEVGRSLILSLERGMEIVKSHNFFISWETIEIFDKVDLCFAELRYLKLGHGRSWWRGKREVTDTIFKENRIFNPSYPAHSWFSLPRVSSPKGTSWSFSL